MDFKKIINTIDDLSKPLETLTESVVAEKAVSKSQQKAAGAALAAKRSGDTSKLKGASKEMIDMSTKELEKFAGTEHKGLPEKKKAKKESIDTKQFKDKFEKMVDEAKDDAKSAAEEKRKKEEKKKKIAKIVDEAAKPDFLDVDKDGDKKEPMKKASKEAKKKKAVKESVEPKLTFRDMMRLVVESGGQQQIDPKDEELFAWATRVAHTKIGEGMKAEVYAGLIYERMGGVFEMYDVLSEDKE
jgi:hypothetical protein